MAIVCEVPTPYCHSERKRSMSFRGLKNPKNLLERIPHTRHGVMIYKGTAFDDIQRLALMIYSHKRLMIYTASRDYGDKSVPFLCFSLFVPQIRGSLDYARDDDTPLVISTKHSAWRNPLRRSSITTQYSFLI